MATHFDSLAADLFSSMAIQPARIAGAEKVLTPAALEFVHLLESQFGFRRRLLLRERKRRAGRIAAGELPAPLAETASVREAEWRVAATPLDLVDRRVEITGPAERKMMINALNSGANVFMADLEDALSPTWDNVVSAQVCLAEAARGTLSYVSPEGKAYALAERRATLLVRPRGWHLEEANVRLGGAAVSASLFDFGLHFFHNARTLIQEGSGPYYYLPKLEGHLEARLWNDVFCFAQDHLGIPRGTIRATVLIETVLAAFEMEEILFELKEHASGLNAGRWDYLFSMIKKLGQGGQPVFPDRAALTMTVPFMEAYTRLLVRSCHRRGAHAIGGMAAFIPSRKDAEVNAAAFTKVREDKDREARGGFDGTWVAHPDLVPVARAAFDTVLRGALHQKNRMPPAEEPSRLLPAPIEGAAVTLAGLRNNVSVALQYLSAWLGGLGAVAIHNLMEDAATAEISRAELWQWVRHRVPLENGSAVTSELFESELKGELERLGAAGVANAGEAAALLSELVLNAEFEDFLTVPAYPRLLDRHARAPSPTQSPITQSQTRGATV